MVLVRAKPSWVTTALHLALLGLLALAFRLPSVEIPFDNDSGAIAYHARLILGGEPLYLTHHPAHHLPGAYYTYAAIFGILGDGYRSVKIALVFWVWVTAWVIYQIGRELGNRSVGLAAAILFIGVSSLTRLFGDTGQIELFANLPLSLVILAGLRARRNQGGLPAYFLTGLLGGIAFLYKAIYLSSLFAVAVMLLAETLTGNDNPKWRRLALRWFGMAAGFLAPLAIVLAYFYAAGALSRLLLVFTLGVGYLGSQLPVIAIPALPLVMLWRVVAVFAFLAVAGLVQTGYRLPKLYRSRSPQAAEGTLLLAWSLASLLVAGASRFYFEHYALLLVPPFAIVVAAYAVEFAAQARGHAWAAFFGKAVPAGILLAVLANLFWASGPYYGAYLRYKSGQIAYDRFLLDGPYQGGNYFAASRVAGYLRDHSQPGDTVLAWTALAQVNYLSGRRSSSDVLWTGYIPALGPPGRVFDPEPLYVVVGWTLTEGTEIPLWLRDELADNYVRETTIENQTLYRRLTP
ncbi:MAG: glycosyltransferase family 39 protein [Chloroflexota bacterium]